MTKFFSLTILLTLSLSMTRNAQGALQVIKSKETRMMPTRGTVRSFSFTYEQILPQDPCEAEHNQDDLKATNPQDALSPITAEEITLNTASTINALWAFYPSFTSRVTVLDSQDPYIQKFYKSINEKILTLLERKTLASLTTSYVLMTLEQKIYMTMHLVKNGDQIHAKISLQGQKPQVATHIINLIQNILADDAHDVIGKWLSGLRLFETMGTLAGIHLLTSNLKNRRPNERPQEIRINIEQSQPAPQSAPQPEAETLTTKPNTKFADIAGAQDAKEALQEILLYLKNPSKYCEEGAKPPRGILLYGPPGTGKTLLAKALAGEADCYFLSAKGSDFSRKFVGESAGAVRKLFEDARKKTPCIIFIDEIDSVGVNREAQASNPHIEQHAALTALLAEMDGFDTKPGDVIVIAATNRRDSIDPALLRPGRFDQHIQVEPPKSDAERKEVLEVHLRLRKIKTSTDVIDIARKTKGFSPAELEAIVNQAAITAQKRTSSEPNKTVTLEDFNEAIDTIRMGAKKRRAISDERKKNAAIRLAGEAALNILLNSTTPLDRVTLEDRNDLGAIIITPKEDGEEYTEEELRNQITQYLGGHAAQTLLLEGKPDTGIKENIKKAVNLALQIATDIYGESEYQGMPRVLQIMEECKAKALQLLTTNKTKLEQLIEQLIQKETIYKDAVRTIMTTD